MLVNLYIISSFGYLVYTNLFSNWYACDILYIILVIIFHIIITNLIQLNLTLRALDSALNFQFQTPGRSMETPGT